MFFSRGKNKHPVDYTTLDAYKYYKTTIEKNSSYDVSNKKYISICKRFNKMLFDSLADTGIDILIPCGMGRITIQKFPMKMTKDKLPINWPKTVEYGKRIYFTNEHSDGYLYKIKWVRRPYSKTQRKFAFIPNRVFQRYVSQKIQNKEIKFG